MLRNNLRYGITKPSEFNDAREYFARVRVDRLCDRTDF